MFYRNQSREMLRKIEISDYLQQVHLIIKNEATWISTYFEVSSSTPIVNCLEQVLIKDHHQQMLEKGFHSLVSQSRIDLLRLLFNFFIDTNLLQHLRNYLSTYIREQCKLLFSAADKPLAIVTAIKHLIAFKTLLDKILTESFASNDKVKQTMRESYDAFLSSDLQPDTSARYLALFIHKQMKKENPLSKHKAVQDEIRGTDFEQVVHILRFLRAKDTFENYFTQHLSERLLKKCSSSHDRELEFINRIKAECGQQFFNKVEQMFNDIKQSQECTKSFLGADPRRKKKIEFEQEYYVLSSASWPISQANQPVKIPQEISSA